MWRLILFEVPCALFSVSVNSFSNCERAVTAGLSRTFLTRLELGQHDPSLSTLVRLGKALRVSVPELLGETMSTRQWWQVGEARFATREDAENHARTAGEMFVARYQNKPGGTVRLLLPVRGTK